MQSPDRKTLISRAANLAKVFQKVEEALDSRPYFQAETIGNVDIAWLVLLHRSAIVEENSDYNFLEKYPRVQRWQSQLLGSGIAKRSVAEDFEKEFLKVYFSKKTYLGVGKDCKVISSNSSINGCCS